ncbi:MAG: (d)CMP kinase [Bacteroidales bacterium]|jgi:cytidylate kinase|nr:(d)CMP kinase [Paludibacteraceae bacterium]MDY6373186.1 (d)CMP kinase [Bacteroidales bacterium]MDY6426807.1 (d)CMP kinase [Bacteroidales bacterium]
MITVAIDGYSSCGKSTMAKQLAKAVGYTYVDTGAMYRAVALYAIRRGWINGDKVNRDALIGALENIDIRQDKYGNTTLCGEDVSTSIRSMEVSESVSYVSAIPEVRSRLVAIQRAMGKDGGVVMDGRDIGTVVFPQAELKVFVTASAEIRAQRRYDEMLSKGHIVDFNEVLDNVKKRDYLDETRTESPLCKADDAFVLDNGNMTIEEQNDWLLKKFDEACRKE